LTPLLVFIYTSPSAYRNCFLKIPPPFPVVLHSLFKFFAPSARMTPSRLLIAIRLLPVLLIYGHLPFTMMVHKPTLHQADKFLFPPKVRIQARRPKSITYLLLFHRPFGDRFRRAPWVWWRFEAPRTFFLLMIFPVAFFFLSVCPTTASGPNEINGTFSFLSLPWGTSLFF